MTTISKKELIKIVEDYAAHLNLTILIPENEYFDLDELRRSGDRWSILNEGVTKAKTAYNGTVRTNEGCAQYIKEHVKSGDIVSYYSNAFDIPETVHRIS